jgi:predicted DNA-binding transcriptional regulator AlpA
MRITGREAPLIVEESYWMAVELLRFRDLAQYGVHNWPTLGRWIEKEDFPAGFYLAANTRAWYKNDCDTWLANRPKADPPPENEKPAPLRQEGSRRVVKEDRHPPVNRIGFGGQASDEEAA